jgi:hypothetical protein
VRLAMPISFINMSVPHHLSKGASTMRLHVPEGCELPSDIRVPNGPDTRCLSVAVQNITISWAEEISLLDRERVIFIRQTS